MQKRKSRDEMQLRSGLQKQETAQIGRAAVDHFAGYSPRSAEEGGGRSAGNCFASGKELFRLWKESLDKKEWVDV